MQLKSSNAVPGASPAAMLAVAAVLVLCGVFPAPTWGQCLADETEKLTA